MNKKKIRTTITLAADQFEDGSNRIIAEDLRTSCTIQFGGGAIVPHAHVTIYGLSMDVMVKLTRIRWRDITSLQNTIKVEAGEEGSELMTVYEGNITFGTIDMSNAPDVAFKIRSTSNAKQLYSPDPPITFEGEKSVVEAIGELASRMGYIFDNSGVPDDLTMTDTTLVDSDLNKIKSLCKRYKIDLYAATGYISIAPQGQPLQGRVAVIAPDSGLLGYPVPTMQGIDFRTLFNPAVRFGHTVRVQDSLITTANGNWRVFGVTINIESELPGGNWWMDVKAAHVEGNNAAINR